VLHEVIQLMVLYWLCPLVVMCGRSAHVECTPRTCGADGWHIWCGAFAQVLSLWETFSVGPFFGC